jgi:hypothetical protein
MLSFRQMGRIHMSGCNDEVAPSVHLWLACLGIFIVSVSHNLQEVDAPVGLSHTTAVVDTW